MYIGVDIGGTTIRVAHVTPRGLIKNNSEYPTQVNRGKEKLLDTVITAIKKHNTARVVGVGIAMRGLVDEAKGLIIESTMMPGKLKGVRLRQIIKNSIQKPVIIENDTNCFTYAEALRGSGKNQQQVVGITLGTGIGGGIVINKHVIRGARGGAGELGHMIIEPHAYKWNSGQRGSFESLCSASAGVYLYKEKTKKIINAHELEQRYKEKERAAQEVVRTMSVYLAVGLANVIHSLNPGCIIIGGGFSRFSEYLDGAIKQVPRFIVYEALKKTPIKRALLGQHAGLIGAAMLAQLKVKSRKFY